MAKVLPAFAKQGEEGLSSRGNKFLKIESGQVINIIPLTSLNAPAGAVPTGNNCVVTFDQYNIWLENLGEGEQSPFFPATQPAECDPGALLGLEPKFMGLLIVVTEDDLDTERILRLTYSGFKALVDIDQAVGGFKGSVIQYKKTGSGQATRYKFINTGRRVQVDGDPETDLTDHLGPTSREEIVEMLSKVSHQMLNQHGLTWPPAGGDPCVKTAGKKRGATKPPPVPVAPADDEYEIGDEDDDAEA